MPIESPRITISDATRFGPKRHAPELLVPGACITQSVGTHVVPVHEPAEGNVPCAAKKSSYSSKEHGSGFGEPVAVNDGEPVAAPDCEPVAVGNGDGDGGDDANGAATTAGCLAAEVAPSSPLGVATKANATSRLQGCDAAFHTPAIASTPARHANTAHRNCAPASVVGSVCGCAGMPVKRVGGKQAN